eukprot:6204863-Pleurochrysis_carterae.AAC.2
MVWETPGPEMKPVLGFTMTTPKGSRGGEGGESFALLMPRPSATPTAMLQSATACKEANR